MNIDRDLLELFLLVIFLVFSAFFSASETAFMSIDRLWIDLQEVVLKKKKSKLIQTIKKIISNPAKFLGAILIGNNLVNVAISSIGTVLAIRWFGGEGEGVVVATIIVTLLLLIFAEVTPKTIASYNPEKVVTFFAYPVDFTVKFFAPVSYIVNQISYLLMRLLGFEGGGVREAERDFQMKHILKVWKKRGLLSGTEERMVNGLISLKTLAVEHVMKLRDKVIYVEDNYDFDKLLTVALNSHFSRFPVLETESSLVKGVIHVKDLLRFCESQDDFTIDSILRKPVFVHPEKNLWDLFKILTKSRGEMAVVVNEYGDFLGIVTLEEILEEIVGEIYDEYDLVASEEIREVASGMYDVDGRVTLHKIEEELDIPLPEDKGKILSQYLINLAGGSVKEGNILEDEECAYRILKMDGLHPGVVRIIKKRRDEES